MAERHHHSWLSLLLFTVRTLPDSETTLFFKRRFCFHYILRQIQNHAKIHHCVKSVQMWELFLVRIFPRSDWIQRHRKYFSVFSPNAGKCRPEITPCLDTFHAVHYPRYLTGIWIHVWPHFQRAAGKGNKLLASRFT